MKRVASYIPGLKLSPQDDPELRARLAWEEAAGAKIARHTRAASLVRGTLVVEVEDMMWQRNLTGFIPVLLRNLRALLQEPIVTSLAFRPMPPRIAPKKAAAARGPRIADDASGIEDPVLRMLYRQNRKKA